MKRLQLGAGWSLWPHALVRGAGFPFAQLEAVLRAPDTMAALQAVAREPNFRLAVTWQNRALVENGLDSFLRREPGASDSRTRKKALVVLRYLQRYAAKNDTIGFFGPVGWATVGEGDGGFVAGPALVSARRVLLEPWAAQAVAASVWSENFPCAVPGDVRVRGRSLETSVASHPLSSTQAALLRACDGERSARRVARAAKVPWAKALPELQRLQSLGVLQWGLPVALGLDPLVHARRARVPALATLEAAVRAVSEAPRDEGSVGAALHSLETTFTALTAQAASRNAGQTYGGRGLVTEECRRDVTLSVGHAPIARVAEPLSLILQVARWYSFTIARTLARGLRRTHRRLGGGRIPLHVFWSATASRIAPAVKHGTTQLQRRWSEVLALADAHGHIDVEAARRVITKRFAAPCPGWPGARHHAPDLMWSAPDVATFLRGEGTPVLAELHPGVTPLSTPSVLATCPDRRALEREWAKDFGTAPWPSPIPQETFARSSHDARLAKDQRHLDLGEPFASPLERARVIPVSAMDVVAKGEQLIARGRGETFDLVALFERRVKLQAAVAFSLGSPAAHVPRITLGDLVVHRETWRFEGAELPLEKLPQRIFVRTPNEVKPMAIDLANALSVDQLQRLARGAERLTVSEMLPGPEGLWLEDAAGARYVSELRFVAVDPEPFDAQRVWG